MMAFNLPTIIEWDEYVDKVCDYLDRVAVGEEQNRELQIAFSGNGYRLTVAAMTITKIDTSKCAPGLDALSVAGFIRKYLTTCGLDTESMSLEKLYSFQRKLYERHALTFVAAGNGDEKSLMAYNHRVLVVILVDYNAAMVTNDEEVL